MVSHNLSVNPLFGRFTQVAQYLLDGLTKRGTQNDENSNGMEIRPDNCPFNFENGEMKIEPQSTACIVLISLFDFSLHQQGLYFTKTFLVWKKWVGFPPPI